MIRFFILIFVSASLSAAPNMILKGSSSDVVFGCKTKRTLGYAERLKLNEPLTDMQKGEINNTCFPFSVNKPVTAFDIENTAQVEVLVLGKLQLLYVDTDDLKRVIK